MISKILLGLPGADFRKSVWLGVLSALASLCEVTMVIVVCLTAGNLLGLSVPPWTLPIAGDTTAALITMVVLIVVELAARWASNSISIAVAGKLSDQLADAMYLGMFRPERNNAARIQRDDENKPLANQSLALLSVEGTKAIINYFTGYIPNFIQVMGVLLVTAITVMPLNWAAGLALILGMVALPVAANASRAKDMAVQMKQLKEYEHVGLHFEEALRGLGTLKIFNADHRTAKNLHKDSEGFRRITMDVLAGQLRSLIASDLVIYLAVILATVLAIITGGDSANSMMVAVIVIVAGVRLFAPERQLVYLSHQAAVAIKQGRAITAAIGHGRNNAAASPSSNAADTNSAQTAQTTQTTPDAQPLRINDGIVAKGLSFTYANGFKALRDIDLNLPVMGHVAICGPSGSGKSTLASLFTGERRDYEGSLKIGGVELRDIRQQQLIDIETVVRGTDHLFSGSLRYNLDPAARGFSNHDFDAVLRGVDLDREISDRTGYKTRVEPNGGNFSGGQKQRLIIARALLRHTPIYIFDEATSAVDRDHDETLSNLITRLAQNALVITITHRLAGIRNADDIIVLDRGVIAEQGDFYTLINGDGLFAAEWQEQERLERTDATSGDDTNDDRGDSFVAATPDDSEVAQ